MTPPTGQLLATLLKQVSRSFYLTRRVLPGSVRPQIGIAYLLARATDTIADTELIPVAVRLRTLEALEERIAGHHTAPLKLDETLRLQGADTGLAETHAQPTDSPPESVARSGERSLLKQIESILWLLERFSADDQEQVRSVLKTIVSGQTLDLQRFGSAKPGQIIALQTDQERDDYTYRVAGCVGEFWTRMCRAHLFPNADLDDASLLAKGIRFGKGLQMVNILRDIPTDLRQGRCYLPAEEMRRFDLTPSALLDSANECAFRPLLQHYIALTSAHLSAGWAYTNLLPRRCVRVRLACAWPLLIAARTLDRLRSGNVLDAKRPLKISRGEVRTLIARSLLYYPWPRAWNSLFPAPHG